VTFYTSLPEDRYVRQLVKYLDQRMPENVAHEEVENLNIRVQEITQLRSACRHEDPTKDRSHSPRFKVCVAWGIRCRQCVVSPSYAVCE